ncbi:type IV secretion system protein [Ancylobacter oerskovii]|uniref:Type IV secretion system protein n=1 Tax=Ancylobacter oerskovii TaxID=459519 RepID=A0ABW4Z6R1_9HYPH|nr:type IV secretion system protein [Ancylobacter oerskovii]MBS7545517.1 type IV secretion system protein [Ancylobacter oerskovii]
MASNIKIFSWFYSEFDTVLNSYIAQKAADIIAAISPTAWIMLGIYFVLWGFSHIRGMIDEPVTDGLFRMLKISVVLGFALNVGLYQTHVVDFLMKTPDAMANILVMGNGNAESGGASTYATLDTLLNKTIDMATDTYNKMSVLSPGQSVGLAIAAILILLFGMGFTITAGIMIILSKVALVLMLAVGPLFILLAMFTATQRFFEQWLQQALNAVLAIVMLLAVCSLFFGLTEQALGGAAKVVESNPIQAIGIVGVASVACTFLLFQVPQLASQLAGGIALPVSQAARKMTGGGVVDAAKHHVARHVANAALAKATGGASAAAKAVGGMFRASNTIRRV